MFVGVSEIRAQQVGRSRNSITIAMGIAMSL